MSRALNTPLSKATKHCPVQSCLNAYCCFKISSQARLDNMAKECGPQAPIVNMVLPNNFGVYSDFGIAAGLTTTTPSNQPHESTCLIPTNVIEGPKMDLKTFCHIYALPDSIRSCLHEHKITGMLAFAHMTSVCRSSSLDWKKDQNRAEPNCKRPDHWS